ncbi:MAG: hypothetical protein CFE21_05840 [Bacteroidetes bacterium B1(2017)]|nr:MAG: hypothetical protein CFE21_05840 [Bacteroidetes bacterium B1(2017)]
MLKSKTQLARTNWLKASLELKFQIISPYFITTGAETWEAFAFLPELGSPNGCLLLVIGPPEFEIDIRLINWAKENQIYYSCLNLDTLQEYDSNYFKETLDDWGSFITKQP